MIGRSEQDVPLYTRLVNAGKQKGKRRMAKKIGKIALTVIVGWLIGCVYVLNLMLFWSQGSAIHLPFMMLAATLFYLLCWLFLLRSARRRNNRNLLRLYLIFWGAAVVHFFVSSLFWFPGLEWFAIVFFLPLAGIDGFIFFMKSGFIHADSTYGALVTSIVMLVLGVAMLKRRTE